MPFLSLKRIKKKNEPCKREDSRNIWINRIWIIGIINAIVYFVLVYILPLYRVITIPLIPFKTAIEVTICLIPVITGVFLSKLKMEQTSLTVSVKNDMILVNQNGRNVGLCCLEIMSTAS